MPTDPNPDLHSGHRIEENDELRDLLKTFAEGLEEIVNFGTNVLRQCHEETQKSMYGVEVAPLILQFRHVLEMTDAVRLLISEGATHPAKLQLRSALEALLGIKYIVEGSLERRAHAFIVCHLHKKRKNYRRFDPDTQMGAEFKSAFDEAGFEFPPVDEVADWEERRESINEIIEKEQFDKAEQEYQRLRDRGSGAIDWYELNNGPSSIEKLAQEVGMDGYYQLFYRHWSAYSHASNLLQSGLLRGEKNQYLAALRTPERPSTTYLMSSTLALQAIRVIVDYFLPGKKRRMEKWYAEEIADFNQEVASSGQMVNFTEQPPDR
jgi:hypothetical protein